MRNKRYQMYIHVCMGFLIEFQILKYIKFTRDIEYLYDSEPFTFITFPLLSISNEFTTNLKF